MFNLGNWANIITFCHESLGITKWMILLKYFDMWSDWIWFMWSYGRLCLIWPITDGLARSMLLFPQRHSHNPSLRAEPWAYSYDMLCLPVCGRANSCVHVVGNVKNTSIWASLHVHMQTYVRCYPYKCTFFSCHCMGMLIACGLHFSYHAARDIVKHTGQAAIGDQYRPGSSHLISQCVLSAVEGIGG